MRLPNEPAPGPYDIVLATATARYSHTAFGLRWLHANLDELKDRACLLEFGLGDSPDLAAERILAHGPRLVALSVHIWNVEPLTELAQILRAVAPELFIVAGGPEVSHGRHAPLDESLDAVIEGEGELVFPSLCRDVLAGRPPAEKVLRADPPPDLARLTLPYAGYTAEDIRNRMLYVETSRGCPFRCAFCLSARSPCVREFPLAPVLAELDALMQRGALRFKFVDRTFNLRQERVEAVLNFFLARLRDGLQLHFEIVPDRLRPEALALMAQFPPGALHLELGVQTFHPPAQEALDRVQDLEETEQTLRLLRQSTGALLHADLIAGLPGETLDVFGTGFNRLIALRPHAIQVGILKRLRGAPLDARAEAWGLLFARTPPYEILQTPTMSFGDLQRIKRFARYFDLYYNSGQFPRSLDLLWADAPSAFARFMDFSDWLWERTGRVHKLALARLAEHLHRYATDVLGVDWRESAAMVEDDFRSKPGRSDELKLGPGAESGSE